MALQVQWSLIFVEEELDVWETFFCMVSLINPDNAFSTKISHTSWPDTTLETQGIKTIEKTYKCKDLREAIIGDILVITMT